MKKTVDSKSVLANIKEPNKLRNYEKRTNLVTNSIIYADDTILKNSLKYLQKTNLNEESLTYLQSI